MRIANLNSMEVRVNVNENDIIRVNVGDSAIVEVDSYSGKNDKFRGIVTQIANTAKDALTLEAVTEFEVRIRLVNDSFKHLANNRKGTTPFRPGMTASVDIITEEKKGVLTVPLSAVTTRVPEDKAKITQTSNQSNEEGNGQEPKPAREAFEEIVFVNRNGKAQQVKVKTGISDFDNIEILSGLKAGDEVISGPFRAVTKQLKDGTIIIVKDEASLAKSGTGEEEEVNN
jgi:HlyD family secretion protein